MNARSHLAVDASVVVKWFVEEEFSSQARELDRLYDELIAPDLLIPELGNVFLKKVRRGEMFEERARATPTRIVERVALYSSLPLAAGAYDIAFRHQRSFYDSLYVSLALQEDCRLVTADEKLYNALQYALPDTMLWIGDVPPLGSDAR